MKRYILVFSVLLISVALNAQAPVANFSADTNFTCAGQTLGFFDLSTNGPTAWSWSFPGGTPSTSNLQNPTVVFNTAGTYTVSLSASNFLGTSNPKTMTIKVLPNPALNASVANITCYGAKNGSININPTSGTSPFQ